MHSDIIIFSRINLVSFREVGIFGCRMCNFCYIHCFVPQQFEAVYTGQNKSSKSICPVVGSSASTRSKSKIERGISSSGNVGWACDQLLALRNLSQMAGPLSPGQSEWVVWVLNGLLHLNLHIGSSVQSADCYCQICKGATQDKWLHSIIMSQSTRKSNNTTEGFKKENLPPPP